MRISIGAGIAIAIFLSGAALAADGEAIYRTNCASCHGPNGQGSPAAPAIQGNKFVLESSDRAIAGVIRNGREGAAKLYKDLPMGMPAQKLTDEELNAIVEYTRKLSYTTGPK